MIEVGGASAPDESAKREAARWLTEQGIPNVWPSETLEGCPYPDRVESLARLLLDFARAGGGD